MIIPCIFIGKTDEKKLKKNSGNLLKVPQKARNKQYWKR
jgi:hypothetical protein